MLHIREVLQLKNDEKVLRILRASWVTLVPQLSLSFLCIVVPFFFLFQITSIKYIGIPLFIFPIVGGICVALRAFMLWDANAFIVTSMRIVNVEQKKIFTRIVTEALQSTIQDISWTQMGMVETVFHIGSISIQTAGLSTRLIAKKISHPEKIQDILNDWRHGKVQDIKPEQAIRLDVEKEIEGILRTYSVEELIRISTILKAREKEQKVSAYLDASSL